MRKHGRRTYIATYWLKTTIQIAPGIGSGDECHKLPEEEIAAISDDKAIEGAETKRQALEILENAGENPYNLEKNVLLVSIKDKRSGLEIYSRFTDPTINKTSR